VVVSDFNVKGISVFPSETDSPLIVDADTVLARTVTLQSFQTVAGWDPQILQLDSIFKEPQFPPRRFEHITGKTLYPLSVPDTLGTPVPEALDHII
jgi:hypothetical protein